MRIWGRGAAAARGCEAAGVGLGYVGGMGGKAGEFGGAGLCVVISK